MEFEPQPGFQKAVSLGASKRRATAREPGRKMSMADMIHKTDGARNGSEEDLANSPSSLVSRSSFGAPVSSEEESSMLRDDSASQQKDDDEISQVKNYYNRLKLKEEALKAQ